MTNQISLKETLCIMNGDNDAISKLLFYTSKVCGLTSNPSLANTRASSTQVVVGEGCYAMGRFGGRHELAQRLTLPTAMARNCLQQFLCSVSFLISTIL